MTEISRLCRGMAGAGDSLRYAPRDRAYAHGPVIVWNCTRACNLSCAHCYSASGVGGAADEMSFSEAERMIGDLAKSKCPAILFSGGEPCMRNDLPELVKAATSMGIKAVLSTNGTILDDKLLGKLADAGLSYVGISIDGPPSVHDSFRRVPGAFDKALRGLRLSKAAGIKTGVRMTINALNAAHIPDVFSVMKEEGVSRGCFYHFVGAGRGATSQHLALSRDETRRAVKTIIEETCRWFDDGGRPEILTVDNHADGPFVLMELEKTNLDAAMSARELLARNGGNASGEKIGCVGWDGAVYIDQFSRDLSLGNVREHPFGEIWRNADTSTLAGARLEMLRDRKSRLGGRCAHCRWLDVCNGNLPADKGWPGNPSRCYLSDEEIA